MYMRATSMFLRIKVECKGVQSTIVTQEIYNNLIDSYFDNKYKENYSEVI